MKRRQQALGRRTNEARAGSVRPKEPRDAAKRLDDNQFVIETGRNLEGDLGNVHDMDPKEIHAFEDRLHKAMSRGLPEKIGKDAIRTAKAIRRDGVQPATARYFPTGKIVAKVDSLIKSEGVAKFVRAISFIGGPVGRAAAVEVTRMRGDKIFGLLENLQARRDQGDQEATAAMKRFNQLANSRR